MTPDPTRDLPILPGPAHVERIISPELRALLWVLAMLGAVAIVAAITVLFHYYGRNAGSSAIIAVLVVAILTD